MKLDFSYFLIKIWYTLVNDLYVYYRSPLRHCLQTQGQSTKQLHARFFLIHWVEDEIDIELISYTLDFYSKQYLEFNENLTLMFKLVNLHYLRYKIEKVIKLILVC
jgi:hypothetical protein